MNELSNRDPKLAVLIETYGPLDIRPRAGGFPDLVHSIIGQQLSDKAAMTIQTRVEALFPDSKIDVGPLEAIEDAALRAAGLSGQKIRYIRGLASHIASGTLDFDRFAQMNDEEVMRALTSVKGIGRWTAEMYLMFTLNRPDIFPIDDVALQAAMKIIYGLDSDNFIIRARKIAEAWRPYRSIACRYLYIHLDRSRQEKAPKA